MRHRSGEMSTSLKILLVALAAIVVLLMIVTMQESLIGTAQGSLSSFIQNVING